MCAHVLNLNNFLLTIYPICHIASVTNSTSLRAKPLIKHSKLPFKVAIYRTFF